jgi:hypothetical protein
LAEGHSHFHDGSNVNMAFGQNTHVVRVSWGFTPGYGDKKAFGQKTPCQPWVARIFTLVPKRLLGRAQVGDPGTVDT